MAEVQKPVATETPAVEPAVVAPVADAPAVEAAPAEPAAAEAAAPAEEAKAAETKKVAEPIYSGPLGYKAPGMLKSLIFSKKHFWFGEDAVPANQLNSYLRGEKPEVAHPVAAWSSQTGKGLLYFAKHGEDKQNPTGVLNLADATDLKKEGPGEFSFRHGGHKHTFESKLLLERDGWYLAFEQAIEEAKAKVEEIKNSEGYKEVLEKLNKPVALASAGASSKAEEKLPKKSAEVKPAEGETRPSSSESESASKKKSKSKSRSVSRGKRNSIFGSFLGKKEEVEAKKEEKKEDKPAETAAPIIEAPAPAAEAPAPAPAATEEAKSAETAEAAPAAEASTETTEATKPTPAPIKTGKRNSVIGTFFEKIRSPTHEKKQSEVVPAVPAKEEAKEPEAPAAQETAAAPAAEPAPAPVAETTETAAAPAEEAKPAEAPATTPKKEKKGFSFDKVFGSVKEKVKSPTTEKAPPAAESSKTEEPPKIEAPVTEAAPEPAKTEDAAPAPAAEPATEAAAPAAEATTPKERRKSSFFGTLKREKKPETNGEAKAEEKEKHPSKLSGLFRNPSKAIKSKKEKEAVKTEETGESSKEEAPAVETAAPVEEKKEAEEPKPAVIGDVVPEAVTVGQAPSSTPAVQAAA